MQKEVLKKLEYELFVVAITLLLMVVMYFLVKPSITGYVVFQPALTADSNINTSDNEYKLKTYTTTSYIINELYTEATLTQAAYNNDDVLGKVNTSDNDIVHADKDKIFDIKFNKALNNNDRIYFKTKSSDSSNVYLCDASISCSSPGYGSVSYNGQENWYSITLSGLSNSKDSFNIDPAKVKFDFINASKNETTIEENISTYYLKSGIVETQDIQPSDLSKWDMFSSSYTLNFQNIIFEYSTDSGQTWNTIPSNNNLSLVNSNKIRLRANLTSNGIKTPVLYNTYLNYSAICRENWTCADWSSCNEGSQSRTCSDSNSCNTQDNKPAESQSCFYAKDFYLLNETNTITIKENTLTALNFTNSQLKIKISSNVTLSFNISQYGFHSNIPANIEPAKKFIDLVSSIADITEATLRIYYTDQDVSNIDENSLKLYYYNETSSSWQPLDSVVNAALNYLEANLTHFSTYGLFGNEKQSSSDRKSDSRIAPPPVSIPKSTQPTSPPGPQPTTTTQQAIAPATTTPATTTSSPTPVTPPASQGILTGQIIRNSNALEIKPLAFIIMGALALILLITIKIEHSRHKKALNKQPSYRK